MAGDINPTNSSSDEFFWYALKVRTRSELLALEGLRNKGYEPFCPTYRERRRYSDRMKVVENVAFPGYLFCRFDLRKKIPVITSRAIEYIVGTHGTPEPIPEQQIASIRRVLGAGAHPVAYFRVGQRVRVEYGALAGVEGILARDASTGRLIISIDLLQRSVALQIDEHQVRPV
ncbi:MAG: transcription termination/antitermination protein NusG [Bryobacteraceae bacterium]